MRNSSNAKARALELIGNGYIYGATGWVCTPEKRRQQAGQYPEWADTIMGVGAKWDGVVCWDCAQFTRTVARAGGITLPSGATSQWEKTSWINKGTIDTLPAGRLVFLYRQANGKMQHTGVALGDGSFVHSKGTAYGVLREVMAKYAWTHWGDPWGEPLNTDGEVTEMEDGEKALYEATLTAQSGSTVNIRDEPGGALLKRLAIGETVEVLSEAAGWAKIRCGETIGYVQGGFLRRYETGGSEADNVTITMMRTDALKLLDALDKATARG